MSLTVLNKKFLAVLIDLGVDISEFPDKTFDGLFETGCNESQHFLEWFCENISGDNVLTDEELSAYDELKHLNQRVTQEDLEKRLSMCYPSYDDVKTLDSDYVNNVLTEDLEILDQDYQELLNIQYSLELLWNDIKKEENNLLEETHKWKNNLEDTKKELLDVNSNTNNLLKTVTPFLLKSPIVPIDFSLLNDIDVLETNFLTNENISIFNHSNLEEKLSIIEHCKISTLGKLEEKKAIHSTLEKIVKNKKTKDANDIVNVYSSPKDANTCERMKEDISTLEKTELVSATGKLSNLELSRAFSHFQLNNLYSVNNTIAKATSYKECMEVNEGFNLLLLHILRRCVQNVNNIDDSVFLFAKYLNKNNLRENDKIEFLNWKSRRYNEVARAMEEKHPLVTALREIVSDVTEKKIEGVVPRLSFSMKLLLQNATLSCQSLYNELENSIRKYTTKLLCGPTKQLQFTEIGIQKKFHSCEYLLMQRKNEVKKLANKYLSFKNAVAQGNRTKLLLWTLFLTNPEKLEYVVRNIEKETILYESKYSAGDTTIF